MRRGSITTSLGVTLAFVFLAFAGTAYAQEEIQPPKPPARPVPAETANIDCKSWAPELGARKCSATDPKSKKTVSGICVADGRCKATQYVDENGELQPVPDEPLAPLPKPRPYVTPPLSESQILKLPPGYGSTDYGFSEISRVAAPPQALPTNAPGSQKGPNSTFLELLMPQYQTLSPEGWNNLKGEPSLGPGRWDNLKEGISDIPGVYEPSLLWGGVPDSLALFDRVSPPKVPIETFKVPDTFGAPSNNPFADPSYWNQAPQRPACPPLWCYIEKSMNEFSPKVDFLFRNLVISPAYGGGPDKRIEPTFTAMPNTTRVAKPFDDIESKIKEILQGKKDRGELRDSGDLSDVVPQR